MRLKDYAPNPKRRKEYVQQPGLLLVGIDVSKTMHDGASKTDEKDAQAVFDLLLQGKFFLPVERDAELKAVHRLMRRQLALKKTGRSTAQSTHGCHPSGLS